MRKLTPLLILHTHTHTVSLNHTNVYSVYIDILCVMIHMMYHTVMHHTHNSHKKSVSYHIYIKNSLIYIISHMHIYVYDIYIIIIYIQYIHTRLRSMYFRVRFVLIFLLNSNSLKEKHVISVHINNT